VLNRSIAIAASSGFYSPPNTESKSGATFFHSRAKVFPK